ncbi:MAG: catalase [Deltaproteobacteria bacterium]|nr:catalase [Deltaproteobacteria bacterium]
MRSLVIVTALCACSSAPPVPAGFLAQTSVVPLRADLGEVLVDDEAAVLADARSTLLQLVESKHQLGNDARDVHAKGHGCAKARFVVDGDVPAELKHGIFANAAGYDAVVRFSTSEPLPGGDDWNPSLKGIGIKVQGVKGPHFALDDEGDTQDFVFNNRPAFPLRDIVDYTAAMRVRRDGGLVAAAFVASHLYALPGLLIEQNLIESPLRTPFWSQTPIAVGDVVTKMSVRPCSLRDNRVPTIRTPAHGPNYLANRVAKELSSSTSCFDFLVQSRPALPKDDAARSAQIAARFPVEDASIAWDELEAPPVKVARLTLPAQDTTDVAWNARCDALHFTPWHSLVAHQPLGSLNRGRRMVYEVLSRYRAAHERRGVE